MEIEDMIEEDMMRQTV